MNNAELFERGKKVLPGGVCSSTRLNQGLGYPVYVERAEGARFTSVDGHQFLDMSCGHGAALLGHGHAAVRDALLRAAELGVCSAADMVYHVELAEHLCQLIPCAERVRFTNSGTEATLHALRLCRAISGRDKILRFTGHFHGYHDYTYIGGHPPPEELAQASSFRESAGIPAAMSQFVIAVSFNDLEAAERALDEHGDEIGTVILEPVDFNCGGILPQPGYLEGLRELTKARDTLLFFDEVQTSFKKSPGGAQQDFGVTPDICTIGKSLGGGLPLSAICGRAELMDRFKPVGDVQHSGTFNGPLPNILAGQAFCNEVTRPQFYPELLAKAETFYRGLDAVIARVGVPVQAPRHGARFGLLMGLEREPVNYGDALAHQKDLMLAFVRESAARGVYFHDYGGGPCHHGFSAAHTEADLDQVLDVVEEALQSIKEGFGAATEKAG
jgi:glutamate-1-semialdehyde 2,1-aminomutase